MESDLDPVFARLAESRFRRGFRLGEAEARYLQEKGLPLVLEHGRKFIDQRLATARPPNDGKQTPYRGHPVFIAQHATGTCCRGCLEKWHAIPRGRSLTDDQVEYVLGVLERWLSSQGA